MPVLFTITADSGISQHAPAESHGTLWTGQTSKLLKSHSPSKRQSLNPASSFCFRLYFVSNTHTQTSLRPDVAVKSGCCIKTCCAFSPSRKIIPSLLMSKKNITAKRLHLTTYCRSHWVLHFLCTFLLLLKFIVLQSSKVCYASQGLYVIYLRFLFSSAPLLACYFVTPSNIKSKSSSSLIASVLRWLLLWSLWLVVIMPFLEPFSCISSAK